MPTKVSSIVLLILSLAVCPLFSQDFYGIDKLQEIRITVDVPNWDDMLDSLKQSGSDERILVSCRINGTTLDSVGMRFKGNSSYNNAVLLGNPKIPLNIKLDEIKPDQNYQGYRTLKLSNVFRDPGFIREVLSYEILRDYMPAPQANFAKVFINERYYGLYTNVESIDSSFLAKHFGTANGNFFKCDPDWHAPALSDCPAGQKASLEYLGEDSLCYLSRYERKSNLPDDWQQLIRLTRRLKHQPDKLTDILNIDQALKMLAFNTVLVNLDSYTGRLCHNYYLYLDSTGRFQPIVWDLNMSFGSFPFSGKGSKLNLKELQTLDPLLHIDDPSWPLISKLLSNPGYREKYAGCIRMILEDHFQNGNYLKRLTYLTDLIREEVKKDPNLFYSYEDFEKNKELSVSMGNGIVPGIKELMESRTRFLLNHFLLN